ncbi:hypothetical protein W97_07374 [Coniosporium apollinis CBS 100218]|uniref:Uncharacterized protein n=1 Tax=Coniosporium apollinis (strain CBS 100218) TaxID=1168221 RepID=R7Z138_CONA1|nr:uncharacterized protein W97_07374 [Coniosporium apollinis CBS 100218]EON67877.1 hypothetical protein W97_07374 [Coniosporium apollinis CBS 100218]
MGQSDATNVFAQSTLACEHSAMSLEAPEPAMPAPGFLHQAPVMQLYAPSPVFAGPVMLPTAPGQVAPTQKLQQQVCYALPYSTTPSIGLQPGQQYFEQLSVQLSTSYGGAHHAQSPYSSSYPMNNAVNNAPAWHFYSTYGAPVYGSPYAPTHDLPPAYTVHPPTPIHDMSNHPSPHAGPPCTSTARPQPQSQYQNQNQNRSRSPYMHSPYIERGRPRVDSKDDKQQPAPPHPPPTGYGRSFADTQHASLRGTAQQAPSPLLTRNNAPSPRLPPSPFPTHSAAPSLHPPLSATTQAPPPPYPAHSIPPSPRSYMLPAHLQPIKDGRCVPPPIPRPHEVPEPVWELWMGVALNQFMNEQPETAYQQAVRQIRSQVKWEEWKKWEMYKEERLGPRQNAQLQRRDTRVRTGGQDQARSMTMAMSDADGKVEMFHKASFPDMAVLAAEEERTVKKSKMQQQSPVAP